MVAKPNSSGPKGRLDSRLMAACRAIAAALGLETLDVAFTARILGDLLDPQAEENDALRFARLLAAIAVTWRPADAAEATAALETAKLAGFIKTTQRWKDGDKLLGLDYESLTLDELKSGPPLTGDIAIAFPYLEGSPIEAIANFIVVAAWNPSFVPSDFPTFMLAHSRTHPRAGVRYRIGTVLVDFIYQASTDADPSAVQTETIIDGSVIRALGRVVASAPTNDGEQERNEGSIHAA